jgi:hypothetical protein
LTGVALFLSLVTPVASSGRVSRDESSPRSMQTLKLTTGFTVPGYKLGKLEESLENIHT